MPTPNETTVRLQVTRAMVHLLCNIVQIIYNKVLTLLERVRVSFLSGKHSVLRLHEAICRKAQRLTYPLLADESGELRKAFGIEPMTRVVSHHACIRVCTAEN